MSNARQGCQARQYGDQISCGRCGVTWDANDPEPPACRKDAEPDLAQENARLREELAAARTRLSGQTCFVPPEFQAEMDDLRRQLAELEAKLKPQEPVAHYAGMGSIAFTGNGPTLRKGAAVYAAPIAPAGIPEAHNVTAVAQLGDFTVRVDAPPPLREREVGDL